MERRTDTKFANRDYGTAVMYAPGKVMIAGGAIPRPTLPR